MTADQLLALNAAVATLVRVPDDEKKYSAEALATIVENVPLTRSLYSYLFRRLFSRPKSDGASRAVAAGVGTVNIDGSSQAGISRNDDPAVIGKWMVTHQRKRPLLYSLFRVRLYEGRIQVASRNLATAADFTQWHVGYTLSPDGTFIGGIMHAYGEKGEIKRYLGPDQRKALRLQVLTPVP